MIAGDEPHPDATRPQLGQQGGGVCPRGVGQPERADWFQSCSAHPFHRRRVRGGAGRLAGGQSPFGDGQDAQPLGGQVRDHGCQVRCVAGQCRREHLGRALDRQAISGE